MRVGYWIFLAGIMAITWVSIVDQQGDDDAAPDSAPILLTVSPTDGPRGHASSALLSLPFGGGLDAMMLTPSVELAAESPTPPSPAPYYPASTVEFELQRGWADGGGLALKSPASLWRMALCESTGFLVTDGFYLGLLQFHPATWGAAAGVTGYWDAYDAYEQGYNGAWHAQYGTVNPGDSGGWPNCWRA